MQYPLNLNLPPEKVLPWLETHGRLLPAIHILLPKKQGFTNIRYRKYSKFKYSLNTFVETESINTNYIKERDLNSTWIWFEVPIPVVFPFTDAPLL
jgi:hypothetical protein